MRLAGCYYCNTLSKLADYDGLPENDALLEDWVQRHRHGFHPDEPGAPRGMVLRLDEMDIEVGGGGPNDGQKLSIGNMVEAVKGKLGEQTKKQWEVRDEVKDDALSCFNKHNNPSWPGKPCSDYKSDAKLLGRKNMPKEHRVFLCNVCPYEETVRMTKFDKMR